MLSQNLQYKNNEQNSNTLVRRDFLKYSSGALSLIYLGGCSSSSGFAEPSGHLICSTVLTTLQRRVTLSQTFSSTIVAKNLQNISEHDLKRYVSV